LKFDHILKKEESRQSFLARYRPGGMVQV